MFSGGALRGVNSKVLSQLNLETGKLLSEMTSLAASGPLLQQELRAAFESAAGAASAPGAFGRLAGGPPNAGKASNLRSMLTKLAFIAVLKETLDKATQSKNFNVETAINDLWTKLDPVRNLGGSTASIDVETQKLQRMIQKRAELFGLLKEAMTQYDQSARGVINSLGR